MAAGTSCCPDSGLHRGPWTAAEDALLTKYIERHGEGNWKSLPKKAGLLRCGKSCRLRWLNYLRPDIKRGNIEPEEEDLIIRLHKLLGNRWSLIAGRLPGRTDNEIKNYWNSHLRKKLKEQGFNLKERSSRRLSKRNRHRSSKSKKNGAEETQEAARTKVYAPKPTRLTSITRNNDFDNVNEVPTSSAEEKGDAAAMENSGSPAVENSGSPWFGVQDVGFLDYQCDAYQAMECDFLSRDNLMERLYQDYLQTLNADDGQVPLGSFAESLFVW